MNGSRLPRRPVRPHDGLWLALDDPANLMLITAVLWTSDEVDPARLRRVVSDRLLGRYPVFTQRPVQESGRWYWETDPEFSLDRHLTVGELPPPGDRNVLQDFVASRRGLAFDPDHPLWTMELVRGFGDGNALVVCSHHAMADGIRLVQVLFGLLDPPGDDEAWPVRVGGVGPRPSKVPGNLPDAASGAMTLIADLGKRLDETAGRAGPVARLAVAVPVLGLTVAAGAAGIVTDVVSSLVPGRPKDLMGRWLARGSTLRNTVLGVVKLASPGSSGAPWSGEAGREKTAVWADPVPLELISAVGQATGTSVNDVCAALVMGAFANYAELEEERELNWLLPVSRSGFDASLPPGLGNDFALVLAGFSLGRMSFRQRLAEVHRRVARIRESYEPMLTFGLQWLAGRAPDVVSEPLTRFFTGKAAGVLTNVPGPRRPMELAGARVEGVVGWAPCSGSQAVTVCVFSYAETVHFGFGTDRALIPDPERLVAALREVIEEATALVEV